MFGYLFDKLQTVRLKARYERMVQERVVELVESESLLEQGHVVSEDAGEWSLLGGKKSQGTESAMGCVREEIREMVRTNPHAGNVLRLLENYVIGTELRLVPKLKKKIFNTKSNFHLHEVADGVVREEGEKLPTVVEIADHLWGEFLRVNANHYSYREHARRTWRDGECFVRKFDLEVWPPEVRFIDPEQIGSSFENESRGSQGILTADDDVETVVGYQLLSSDRVSLKEVVPAESIHHTKIGVDSNEKRGVSYLAPIMKALKSFESWMETELLARKLQSSIVLWRKVQGSASQVASRAAVDSGGTSVSESGSSVSSQGGDVGNRERIRPGTILTTSGGTDVQFLQPNTNFSDAVPLGRTLLLSAAAGAGLPEFMLTSDASNGSFSSTMVAESAAVKLFESEQKKFSQEFERLWRWVMLEAISLGLLPDDFFDCVGVIWQMPRLVSRDRSKDRLVDLKYLEAGILEKDEVRKRLDNEG